MTNAEAIETLRANYPDACFEQLRCAVDMAIKALEEPQRKKGKWEITEAYPHNVYCSECHKKFAQTHWAVWEDGSLPRNFCPNCGADMREPEDIPIEYFESGGR